MKQRTLKQHHGLGFRENAFQPRVISIDKLHARDRRVTLSFFVVEHMGFLDFKNNKHLLKWLHLHKHAELTFPCSTGHFNSSCSLTRSNSIYQDV